MSDSMETIRRGCNLAAKAKGEWAGAPVPHDLLKLRVEPRYPFQALNGKSFENLGEKKAATAASDDDAVLVNTFTIVSRGLEVVIWREKGKTMHAAIPMGSPGQRANIALSTFMAFTVWDLAAELKAVQTLGEMIAPHLHEAYQLTGSFIETSKRSGVTYLFRKLRPTLAMRPGKGDKLQAIAALCLHPIGYYEETFAGCMVPTDDVIAHLTLMRGDEPKFWAKANHHCLYSERSGL